MYLDGIVTKCAIRWIFFKFGRDGTIQRIEGVVSLEAVGETLLSSRWRILDSGDGNRLEGICFFGVVVVDRLEEN